MNSRPEKKPYAAVFACRQSKINVGFVAEKAFSSYFCNN